VGYTMQMPKLAGSICFSRKVPSNTKSSSPFSNPRAQPADAWHRQGLRDGFIARAEDELVGRDRDGVRLMSSADARSVGFSWQEGTREFYTSHRETMPARGVTSPVAASKKEALVRFTPRSLRASTTS
jgi:hypothetical protein